MKDDVIEFIKQCRQADIIPRFLKFRIPHNGCFDPMTVHNFQRNLLKNELNKAKKLRETHSNIIEEKRSTLKSNLPMKLVPSVVFYTRQRLNQVHSQVSKTHQKKIELL